MVGFSVCEEKRDKGASSSVTDRQTDRQTDTNLDKDSFWPFYCMKRVNNQKFHDSKQCTDKSLILFI